MTTTRKFIGRDDERITREVDGFGAGFPHVGLGKIAEAMGYGSVGSSYGMIGVYAERELTDWTGKRPALIGWIIEVAA